MRDFSFSRLRFLRLTTHSDQDKEREHLGSCPTGRTSGSVFEGSPTCPEAPTKASRGRFEPPSVLSPAGETVVTAPSCQGTTAMVGFGCLVSVPLSSYGSPTARIPAPACLHPEGPPAKGRCPGQRAAGDPGEAKQSLPTGQNVGAHSFIHSCGRPHSMG